MPPLFFSTVRKELFRTRFFFFVITIAILYFLFSIYILNYHLVITTLLGSYPLSYKMILLYALLLGARTAFTPLSLILIIIDALLVGANLGLLVRSVRKLRNQGMVELSIGGATILGLVSAGCGSCGLSLLAVLGISSSLTFLPFKGLELHVLATILLGSTFIYLLSYLHRTVYCSVK